MPTAKRLDRRARELALGGFTVAFVLIGVAVATQVSSPGSDRAGAVRAVLASFSLSMLVLLIVWATRSAQSLRRARYAMGDFMVDAHIDEAVLRDLRHARLELGQLREVDALGSMVTLSFSGEGIELWSGSHPRLVVSFGNDEIVAMAVDEVEFNGRAFAGLRMTLHGPSGDHDVRVALSRECSSGFRKLRATEIEAVIRESRRSRE